MEEGQFRNKIYWFTFLFSVLVVWVHSANAEIYLGWTDEAYLLYAFENFIGNVVAQVAVPGCFMILSRITTPVPQSRGRCAVSIFSGETRLRQNWYGALRGKFWM